MKTGVLFYGKKSLAIDAPTRIGRSPETHEYGASRQMPVDLSGVHNQLIVPVAGVSRNQAVIWPQLDDQGGLTGQFYIQDLRSKNHTFVQRQGRSDLIRVPFMGPIDLRNGDEVIIGGARLQFVVKERTLSRYALIVGTDKYGKWNDLLTKNALELRQSLLDLGFDARDVVTLVGASVTNKHVLASLRSMSKRSQEQGLFVFYYIGHGRPEGALDISGPGEDFVPAVLEDIIHSIKGNKLVVLECCFAGKFRDVGSLPNCAFVGSSKDDQPSWLRGGKGVLNKALIASIKESLSKNHNYINVKGLELDDHRTRYYPGDQEFTINGSVCFTIRQRDG